MLDCESDDIISILYRASRLEEYVHKFYCLLDKLAKDEESKKVFRALAREEEKHLEIIKSIIKEKKMDDGDLMEFKAHDFFNKDLKKIMGEGQVTALKYAIEIEQKVSDFYYSSLRHIDDSKVRRIFLDLIEDEEDHKDILSKQLTGLMDSLLKELSRPLPKKRIDPMATPS